MTEILLSAGMIARNEEKRIGQCLRSLQGLADELVVLDTGSTDETVRVAVSEGARVIATGWPDDYAAARNQCISHCRGRWILMLDCDEQLARADIQEARKRLRDESNIACLVQTRYRLQLTPYWRIRIFRNHPEIRYSGSVHETITASLLRLQGESGAQYTELPLLIVHSGWETGVQDKHSAYIPMLEAALPRQADQTLVLCHLAGAYESAGQVAKAGAMVEQALEVGRRWQSPFPRLDALAYCWAIQWRVRYQLPGAAELAAEALAVVPEHQQLRWLLAREWMREQQYEPAIAVFQSLLTMNPAEPTYWAMGYDERIFGAFSHDSLAICYFHLGRYKEASRHFGLAAQLTPHDARYPVKQALCEALLS